MDLQLKDKTALITASTGGIGFAIARALAAEGARVIVNGRSEESVNSAIKKLHEHVPGAVLIPLAADNGASAGCLHTLEQVPEVDILINNLGIYEAVGFFDETDADWQKLFEVNIMSGVRLARHYLKSMLKRNSGRIIFIASEAAVSPSPEMAHYSATKSMQLSISRSLAELTKGTKVTVNVVMPGSTKTEGVAQFVQGLFPEHSADAAETQFMRQNRPTSLIERLIDPAEVGDLVAFVCSPRASAINGAALRVDGGLVRSII